MGNTSVEVKVKIVLRESVKPSIPTPSHRKNFTLSYVDQILPLVPPFLTSVLVFYAVTPETQPLNVNRLKSCLSKTLNRFYPLAGQIKQSTITCNDEGIPFIQTQVNCPISYVLNSPRKLNLVNKFLPPRDSLGVLGVDDNLPIMLVHLAIQINVFTCGGVAIGWYDIHKVTDGTSSATFFKYWAALTRDDFNEKIVHQPDFEAAITAFPPQRNPELLQMGMANDNGYKNHIHGSPSVVVKSYIFRNDAIANLKARASSQQVPNPTRFQAMAGFIWEQLLVVSEMAGDQCDYTDTTLQITVDLRPFMNPPLPKGSIGNLIDTAVARAGTLASLPDLAAEIHGAVSKMKDEISEKYHGEKGVEAVRASWDKLIPMLSGYKERAYKVVSWCKLGFSDLDFGFGKPKWMVPTDAIISSFHKNVIILSDFTDSNGDGVEAWFFLEEKDIKILESNSYFLALASPFQRML